MKGTASILLIVSCLGPTGTIGCGLTQLKSSKASPSPGPSAHDSDPTAGHSDVPSTGNEKQSEPTTINAEVIDELHTPAKGSEERQAIMDTLREEFNNRQ